MGRIDVLKAALLVVVACIVAQTVYLIVTGR
jgi:hypothetical protein